MSSAVLAAEAASEQTEQQQHQQRMAAMWCFVGLQSFSDSSHLAHVN
jgi:hypothetical protein